jgi:CubicO group peptidase (beta-lactamase class C family)
MKDTSFQVPREKLARFATSYCVDPDSRTINVYDRAEGGQWSRPPAFQSGADGLVSTVDDYLAFATMLLNRGVAGRERLLSSSSVDAMITDQLTVAQRAEGAAFLDGRGWGFGIAVTTTSNDRPDATSQYGWDGGLGTSWSSDPAKQLIGILMTQTMWMSPTPPSLSTDFWRELENEA